MPENARAFPAVTEKIRIFKVIAVQLALARGAEEIDAYVPSLISCKEALAGAASGLVPESSLAGFGRAFESFARSLAGHDRGALNALAAGRLIPFANEIEKILEPGIFSPGRENDSRLLSGRFVCDGVCAACLNESAEAARREVLDKLSSNHYALETPPCVCGGESFTDIAYKDRYGLPVTTALCKNCGLLLTRPRMTEAAYSEFYEREYRRLYTWNVSSEPFYASQVCRGRKILDYVKDALPERARVLEIGCGAGGILEPFAESGCEALGVDIGGEYLEIGGSKGLDLRNMRSGSLLETDENSFDLIILSHAAEHFLDIPGEFGVVRRLLRDGGRVYVEVPGIKNICAYNFDYLRYFQNAHTYHFTLDTLRQTLSLCGFALERGDEAIVSVFSKSKAAGAPELANYYADNTDFIFTVEKYFY
ncbi:MAG: class I SAM-dependent methyltransferase [Firmicutes bacterium]|nr:class I SAM-dependent methyltransferase [Bacillota bacterium]